MAPQASSSQSLRVASAVERPGRVHQPAIPGRAEPDPRCTEAQHHPLLLQVRNCSKTLKLQKDLVLVLRQRRTKHVKDETCRCLCSAGCGRASITTWRRPRPLVSHLPTSCPPSGRSPSSWRRSWPVTRRYRPEEPPSTTQAPDKAYNTQTQSQYLKVLIGLWRARNWFYISPPRREFWFWRFILYYRELSRTS